MRLLILLILSLCVCFAHAQTPTESQVKAAYVLNFAKFTDWPPAAFGTGTTTLNVCVFGTAETASGFASIHGKLVHGREANVRLAPKSTELNTCHVLYLDAGERTNAAAMLKAAAGRPVLTVGDGEGFVDLGGMLALVLVDGRVRFDANREAVRAHGLQLRAQLLSLARVVR